MSDDSKITQIEQDLKEVRGEINENSTTILKLGYDYKKIEDAITPLRSELKNIIESITGEAGNIDKIGLVGQLRDLLNSVNHLTQEVASLKAFEKEQNKFNLITATKNAVIPIIFAILLHIMVFLFDGGGK